MAFYSEEDKSEDYLFKIVLIGDSAVGKSNLLARFARNRQLELSSKPRRLKLMGRKLRHRSGTQLVKSGSGLLRLHITEVQLELFWFMTSVDNRLLKALADGLMNLTSDLKDAREVSMAEGKSLAETQGLFFMETSALDSSKVTTAFQTAVKEIYNILSREVIQSQEPKQQELWMGNGKTVVLNADENQEAGRQPKKAGCCSS